MLGRLLGAGGEIARFCQPCTAFGINRKQVPKTMRNGKSGRALKVSLHHQTTTRCILPCITWKPICDVVFSPYGWGHNKWPHCQLFSQHFVEKIRAACGQIRPPARTIQMRLPSQKQWPYGFQCSPVNEGNFPSNSAVSTLNSGVTAGVTQWEIQLTGASS